MGITSGSGFCGGRQRLRHDVCHATPHKPMRFSLSFSTNRSCHLKLHEDRLGDEHKDDGRVKRLSLLRDKVREIARSEYGNDPGWGESYHGALGRRACRCSAQLPHWQLRPHRTLGKHQCFLFCDLKSVYIFTSRCILMGLDLTLLQPGRRGWDI